MQPRDRRHQPVLAIARGAGLAVVHATTVWEAPLQATHPFERAMLELQESFTPHGASNFAHHKSPGSAGAQFVSGLDVQPSDIIVDSKRTFDSFHGTPLEQLLRALNIQTLLVAGCNTNTCVLSTAFGGYNRGFRMVIVSECVASAYGNDLHEFALANIQRRLGWVLTLDEVAGKLAGKRAGERGHARLTSGRRACWLTTLAGLSIRAFARGQRNLMKRFIPPASPRSRARASPAARWARPTRANRYASSRHFRPAAAPT